MDGNVVLDVLTRDPRSSEWWESVLTEFADQFILAINPIVYAEGSMRFERIEDLDSCLSESNFRLLRLPWEAAT